MTKTKYKKCEKCGIKKEENLRDLCDKCLKKHNHNVVKRFLATSDIWK